MSGYKNFAVVGAGNIGKFIIDELLSLKAAGTIASVVIVSRSDASTPEWKSKGATFAKIDYASPETISAAFANIDVVISTIGGTALGSQVDLLNAAKSSGVKLFVPSEFGNPTDTATDGAFYAKKSIHLKLKEVGLPYTLFFTGPFSDYLFVPVFGWDAANGKVNLGGEGKTPISFTHRQDIARYLGYVLTTFPTSKLEWITFRIEGERLSFNDIVAGYEKRTGKKLEVTYTSQEALKEALAKNPYDFASLLKLVWDQGAGVVGTETDNKLWPEWNPKKVVDIITAA